MAEAAFAVRNRARTMDGPAGCHIGVWGLLAVTALALVASLIMNIFYCMSANRKAPSLIYRNVNVNQLQSPMVQEVDDYPIYGNLTQDNAIESEFCYEAMTPANRSEDETKVAIENQMCYASLDLTDEQKKRRRKMEQKTNNEKSDTDGNLPTLTSQPSLYLNSDQINFNEGRKEEDIHNDSTIFYGKINTSHSKLTINTARAFDSASDF
ncbi:T-cell receptor-associated transmembrane adapter 1-like isoform X2 [Hemitrygon akajei]|uniref:T-cell receptor-associated transmembrane adapter 1-like isoform X2 n=1 Tax=Hemitrygon akajei TaxID=2704970 RepID=UPI003BF9BDFC